MKPMKTADEDKPVGGLMPKSGPAQEPSPDLRAKRRQELEAEQDQFEQEFSKDSDEPLTDSVRAARARAVQAAEDEDDEYATAYEEENAENSQ